MFSGWMAMDYTTDSCRISLDVGSEMRRIAMMWVNLVMSDLVYAVLVR